MVRVPKDKNDAFKQQVFQMQHSQITIESDKASCYFMQPLIFLPNL